MGKIILFNKKEIGIINQVHDLLKGNGNEEEIQIVNNNKAALNELAESISLYPSILGTHRIGDISRSVETLVEMLCENEGPDIIMHIPTKAILGRGYTIAKMNFFFMLLYIAQDIFKHEKIERYIKSIILDSVFMLMVEEVFLSIIRDMDISKFIRTNAGYFIAGLWDNRLDYGVSEFAPILNNIWQARQRLTPHYGTLLLFSELCKISENSDDIWLDYLQSDDLSDEEVFSLEEFILGLSYEETSKLRQIMDKRDISTLNKDEAEEIIGVDKMYPDYSYDDPRELYRSFKHRKNNAQFRLRSKSVGPKKTIEEYVMRYLLARPDNIVHYSKNINKYIIAE